MRILITGTSGQVDTALRAYGDRHDLIFIGLPDVDLSHTAALPDIVKSHKPEAILSVAAYTAVDKAESESDLVHAVNAGAPKALAEAAAHLDIPIVHISTDYVFDGSKSSKYIETDAPAPISVYGHSKLLGEQNIAKATHNYAVLRTAWVYSPFGTNFVKTMLRLAETRDEINVVADQYGCPTYALDIAKTAIAVAERLVKDKDPELRGVFHLTSQGEAHWAQFAEAIFEGSKARGGRFAKVNHITTDQYPTPAKRPVNSRLSAEKLKMVYGIELPQWQQALDHCLSELIIAQRSPS